jgi:hypothetical protein
MSVTGVTVYQLRRHTREGAKLRTRHTRHTPWRQAVTTIPCVLCMADTDPAEMVAGYCARCMAERREHPAATVMPGPGCQDCGGQGWRRFGAVPRNLIVVHDPTCPWAKQLLAGAGAGAVVLEIENDAVMAHVLDRRGAP